jgi:hypothetical protein
VHFNDVLVFTGENVFRARRFFYHSSAPQSFAQGVAIATGKLLLFAAALG